MKKIASLANDERVPKKRKKGNGGGFFVLRVMTSAQLTSDDMFGADDADWAIYRKIVRDPRFSIMYCCQPRPPLLRTPQKNLPTRRRNSNNCR